MPYNLQNNIFLRFEVICLPPRSYDESVVEANLQQVTVELEAKCNIETENTLEEEAEDEEDKTLVSGSLSVLLL